MTIMSLRTKRKIKSQNKLTSKLNKTAFFLVFSTVLFSTIKGQTAEIESKYLEEWIDIKSSPLKFSVTENRRFGQLVNHSSAVITGFSLGCIQTDNGIHKAIKEVVHIESKILGDVGKNKSFYFADLSLFEEYELVCKAEKSLLGVYKINFDDGSVWSLNNSITESKLKK